jgi:hypothetical protein
LGVLAGEGLACYHFAVKDACGALGEEYWPFAARVWAAVAAICAAAFCAGFLGHALAVGPVILRWFEVGALTTLATTLVAWIFGLSAQDREQLATWGKSRWAAIHPGSAGTVGSENRRPF